MVVLVEQLKKLRQEKHLSQEDLAKELFISRQAISKWEQGDASPDLEHLIKLAEIFEVSLDYLILGKEPVVKEIIREVSKQDTPTNVWDFLLYVSTRKYFATTMIITAVVIFILLIIIFG